MRLAHPSEPAPGTPGAGEPGTDQAAAQRAWLALLRGDASLLEPLPHRQWHLLADEATRHHLRGVTYRLLTDSAAAARVPPEVRERLRSFFLETAGRNALFSRQLSQLVKDLAAREIPVMLLKGVHLARFVYAEPALRSMADVDIMVPRDCLAKAERVFVDRGFGPVPRPDVEEWSSRYYHLSKLVKDGWPVVELHWTIEHPAAPFRIPVEGLWERSRDAVLDGAPVRLLSPEDLLLHLALHLSYHHRFKRAALKGLVDIAAVLAAEPGLDWEATAGRAAEWGMSEYLYTSLRLAVELLGVMVPEGVVRALPHESADDEVVVVAQRYVLTLHTEVPRVFVRLAEERPLRERVRLLLKAVFLPRATMEGNYGLRAGSPLVYPAYAWRVAGLAWNRGTLLFRSLFRTPEMAPTLRHEQDRLLLERWHAPPPEE